jgi:hypothetical protein
MPIFILFAILIVAIGLYSWYAANRREQELLAWAQGHGLSFSKQRSYGLDERYPEFDCLRRGSNRYSFNTVEGTWQERSFLGFDYHYETQSTDTKGHTQTHDHHFSAIVIGSAIPLKPLLIRPERFLDKVAEFFGLDDIDFESAEFSRKFYVKAADRKWAYDVIHPRTMEFMLGVPAFPIQFGTHEVIVYRDTTFSTAEFEQAAGLISGILDRLPSYVVRQLAEEAGSRTAAETTGEPA